MSKEARDKEIEFPSLSKFVVHLLGCTPRGSCNDTLLRRVLRRFFKGSAA